MVWSFVLGGLLGSRCEASVVLPCSYTMWPSSFSALSPGSAVLKVVQRAHAEATERSRRGVVSNGVAPMILPAAIVQLVNEGVFLAPLASECVPLNLNGIPGTWIGPSLGAAIAARITSYMRDCGDVVCSLWDRVMAAEDRFTADEDQIWHLESQVATLRARNATLERKQEQHASELERLKKAIEAKRRLLRNALGRAQYHTK
ncbi:unnamed protein product, partial [Phaeothamnion confervicola]